MTAHKKPTTTTNMLILFVVLVGFVSAAEECPSNPAICMMDLLKSWEEVRVSETNATNVLLPVVYYSKNALIPLCESYSNVAEKCGLGRCHVENPVAQFVSRHFSFVCDKNTVMKYFGNQKCITTTLMASNCTGKIDGEPKIGGELNCPKLDEFVTCVEEPLRTACGNEAYALVMKTVEQYGCPGKIEVARVNEFLSIGVESSTVVVENSATTATEERKIEMNMLVTTSLEVDEAATTPTEMMQEVTSMINDVATVTSTESVTESTTTSEAITTQAVADTTTSAEEIESSGETARTEQTTTTVVTRETTPPIIIKRRKFSAENMTDCYTSIVGDFGRFLNSRPTASFVRFPLFGVKPMELEVLCSKFEVASECVNSFCVGNCRHPAIKSFVDSQLKEVCSLRDLPDFELEFTCLQNVLKDNTDCISFLNSTNPNRCDGHPQFRSCITDRLIGDCSDETVKLMDRMVDGFGCKQLIGTEEPEGSADFLEEGSGRGSGEMPDTDEGSIQKRMPPNMTDETLLTEEIKPKTCDGSVRNSALACLAPLLRLWTGIKENRKETEVVFPIFEFSKIELLELCDAFANYRNCIKFTDSAVCKSEPVISFAEEHFGQVCTTQQIEASMRTHDCINSIGHRDMAVCQKYSKGDTIPGKRKCPKVRRYTKCLRKLVATSCGHLMLAQFDMIVHRFGC